MIEALLAAAIFALATASLVGIMLYGEESSALAARRSQAVLLAEEGLEAVRNIRDASFDNLADGSHGLKIVSEVWTFFGTSDAVGEFTRVIDISAIDSSRKQAQSTVSWQQNLQRAGEVSAVTYFTDWQAAAAIEDCSSYCVSLDYSAGACRQNSAQCGSFGETHESGGDAYCTGGSSADTCCCAP